MPTLTDKIKELELNTREIGGVLWGDDKTRNNGLRKKVSDHEERLNELALGIKPTEPIEPILVYIQELRDITKQKEFPNNIIWPEEPK